MFLNALLVKIYVGIADAFFPVTFLFLPWPDDDHLVGRNMSPFNF
jgi:hypothetical protein